MPEPSPDELRVVISTAREHAAAQRAEAQRLEAEVAALNERLGAARLTQEHMLRPTTLLTEAGRQRLDHWLVRLRIRRAPT